MLDTIAISIDGEDLATLSQQMHKVATIPASRIQHTHSRRDVPPEDLIEDIDVNLSKLFLNVQCHAVTIPTSKTSSRCPHLRQSFIVVVRDRATTLHQSSAKTR